MTADLPRLLACDLDGTLCQSSDEVSPQMCAVLLRIMDYCPVGVCTSAAWSSVERQLVEPLGARVPPGRLAVMASAGAERFENRDGRWVLVSRVVMPHGDRVRARDGLEAAARELGLWEADDRIRGARIDDRETQVTFSARGVRASLQDKHSWDPNGEKRRRLQELVARRLPDLNVGVGGSTSVDVSPAGVDKAGAVTALAAAWGVAEPNVLYVGDQLQPGGNDHPVSRLGVRTAPVTGPPETLRLLEMLARRWAASGPR